MNLLPFEQTLANKKILITGHTGFTGGWACLWLHSIGATVAGFSLLPESTPSLYEALQIKELIPTTIGDICDFDVFLKCVDEFRPDIILHLAAQPLVRKSYHEPLHTFAVNAQGTANVLEAARLVKSVRAVLCITTDKVYKNNQWVWPYRENDPLGGKDPYSASKAAAEMIIQSYATSYPASEGKGPLIATARGGNIIGGGDWSEDRLIPDFVRALTAKTALTLRFPEATRPWQHVLALVHGYLMLMGGLLSDNGPSLAQAWNLGPQDLQQYSVRDVLEQMAACWDRPELNYMDQPLPEATLLALDSTMARNILGWCPVWNTQQMVAETAAWYREFYHQPENAVSLTMGQIEKWRKGLSG